MKNILKIENFSGTITYLHYPLEKIFVVNKISQLSGTFLVEIEIKKKENRLRNMDNIDIFDAAIYMVALHYKAKKSYACNRTKIEKLLAIADLITINNSGKKLFPQYPIFINTCGIGYCILAKNPVQFPMDNIIDGEANSLTSYSLDDPLIEIDEETHIPEMYLEYTLTENQKKLLKDVFCKFGVYSAKFIGSTMDDFKDCIRSNEVHFQNSKYTVDEQKARDFFISDSQILEANFIAKYIKEYQCEL